MRTTPPSKGRSLRLPGIGILAFLLMAAAVSCGQGEKEQGPAPTAAGTAASLDIRQVDLSQVEAVRKLIDRLGAGEVVPAEVLFADLTEDGREEAVVPIFSGGTGGHLAYAVFGYQ